MQIFKNYWWVIAILVILLFLWYVSVIQKPKVSNCKKIPADVWRAKKENLKNTLDGNWDAAQAAMLEAGYCETPE